jgi:hypothetical protein
VSRRLGRGLAIGGAGALLAWSWWAARRGAMPEYRVYDGYWMMLWGGVAAVAAAALTWSWRRERSLGMVTLAAAIGSWAPIAASAARHHVPLLARLRGAWALTGADVVGLAVPVALALLWLAIREHAPAREAR